MKGPCQGFRGDDGYQKVIGEEEGIAAGRSPGNRVVRQVLKAKTLLKLQILLRRLPLWLAKPSMKLLILLVSIHNEDSAELLHHRSQPVQPVMRYCTPRPGYLRQTNLSDLTMVRGSKNWLHWWHSMQSSL